MSPREASAQARPGTSAVGLSSSRRSHEEEPGLLSGDLMVEYPPTSPGHRRRRGISGIGVFFIAVFAQVFVLGTVAGLAIAFPNEASALIARVRMHFAAGLAEPEATKRQTTESANASDPRMEILRLEDRAIWRRDREAWDELRERVAQLPAAHPDHEAVQASLIRIQMAYDRPGLADPPSLDPREIFPTAATESEIPVASLIQVLHDLKQDEVKRQRCAFLLESQSSPAARSALFQAIQEDRSLLVVRQAFDSFRTLTGYPGQNCFDADAVARWWSRNAHAALGQK